jgi:hypothetical protein
VNDLLNLTQELAAWIDGVDPNEAKSRPSTRSRGSSNLGDLDNLTFDLVVDWLSNRIEHQMSQGQADLATDLFMSRSTLCRRLDDLGIEWKQAKWAARAKLATAAPQSRKRVSSG